jgi:hypothetical protein
MPLIIDIWNFLKGMERISKSMVGKKGGDEKISVTLEEFSPK